MTSGDNKRVPRIAVTAGDINGIGPELILKTLPDFKSSETCVFLLIPLKTLQSYAKSLNYSLDAERDFDGIISSKQIEHIINPGVYLVDLKHPQPEPEPGKPTSHSGEIAFKSFKIAVDLCNEKQCDAVVTAPISKIAMYKTGFKFPGHTEYLAHHSNTKHFMMLMVSGNLRVGLQTIHIPLKVVASKILKSEIVHSLETLINFLTNDCGIHKPAIAVLGVNPHAGEDGSIGDEEQQEIIPAISQMKQKRTSAAVDGPFPADSFFGSARVADYDAILAMYHDQGLGPFKTQAFHDGVNVTAGLPFVRTSPDHGTAFGIAGNGEADPTSFKNAFSLAQKYITHRWEES